MFRAISAMLGVIATALATPIAQAQTAPVPGTAVVPPANPDADALAAQMRLLADNPENPDALIIAGQLATRLGDLAGAEAFFRRADQLGTNDPRLLAAKAMLAVRQERPGQALMLFDQASAHGLALDDYLADRGLAYDLVGDQPRAQRDYKDALKRGASDETIRRYALSLGIADKRELALAQLDPLVRKSDRGAWRVRAFVLAMTGDPKGAEQIANAMLPPAMASGLQHFFYVLPTLAPADKAFAVHFGELRATPERLADARLAPPLTPLVVPPEPTRVAAAAVPASPAKARRGRNRVAPAVVATPVSAPVAAVPLPPPPREEVVTVDTDLPPAHDLPAAPPPSPRPAPVVPSVAAATPKPVDAAAKPVSVAPAAERPPTPVAAPVVQPVVAATPATAPALAVATPPPVAPTATRPMPGAPERPSETVSVTTPTVIAPTVVAAAVRPEPPKVTDAPAPKLPRPVADSARPVRSDDALLSTIVAGLAPPAKPKAKSPPPAALADDAKPEPRGKTPAGEGDCLPAQHRKGAKPAAAHKKAAATGCPVDKAAKTKKDDPAKKEPARIWVQVAGGANQRDLIKAWNAAKAKAPAAFKGRKSWTTPLRVTNRVLTGPFKTRDEAQDFVNSVAKSGISAFVFESEAGQKIDPLNGK